MKPIPFAVFVFLAVFAGPSSALQSRAAITTTIRVDSELTANWSGVIKYWLQWHLCKMGFDKVYFYPDSDDTSTFLHALVKEINPTTASKVEVVDVGRTPRPAGDQAVWDLHSFISQQISNCNDAVVRARASKMKWLFHIDVDELFHVWSLDLATHLQWLEKHKVGTVNYANHEAAPETHVIDTPNYFDHVTRFKRHPGQLGFSKFGVNTNPNSPLVKLGFDAPIPSQNRHTKSVTYFVSYANGKSAVRVLPYGPDLPVSNNHSWKLPQWMIAQGFKSWTGIREMEFGEYNPDVEATASIFHFVNCGYSFWRDKYRILGNFHDKYKYQYPIPWDSFRQSRDVISTKDEEETRMFYSDTFLHTPEQIQRLSEHGVLIAFDATHELTTTPHCITNKINHTRDNDNSNDNISNNNDVKTMKQTSAHKGAKHQDL